MIYEANPLHFFHSPVVQKERKKDKLHTKRKKADITYQYWHLTKPKIQSITLSSNLLRNLFKSSAPDAINDPFKIEHRMQCRSRELHA
jgi:hypothetical protein